MKSKELNKKFNAHKEHIASLCIYEMNARLLLSSRIEKLENTLNNPKPIAPLNLIENPYKPTSDDSPRIATVALSCLVFGIIIGAVLFKVFAL